MYKDYYGRLSFPYVLYVNFQADWHVRIYSSVQHDSVARAQRRPDRPEFASYQRMSGQVVAPLNLPNRLLL